MAEVNVRKSRLEAMLKILEVDGAVERAGRGGWQRTREPWSYDEDRVERVTAARRAEQEAMRAYGATGGCLMQFLRDQLDDSGAAPCGRCMNCTGTPLQLERRPELVAAAQEFLRNRELTVEPRLQWPTGLADRKGRIAEELRLQPGRALCVENDGGWGQLVRTGRAEGRFSDELVAASARLIRRWNPDPFPAWATCIPTRAHPELVPAFARALAVELGIELRPLVARVRDTPPQRGMENSAQQLTNVLDAFELRGSVPDGPVLLIDDVVDSRWTITVVGALLRERGSGPVFPFALAASTST
jgi:ATP-dependent DNA helicase RecQ